MGGVLRAAWSWPSFAVLTAVLGTVAAAAGALRREGWVLAVVRAWARSCLVVAGCGLRVEGLHHVDGNRRYVVMANHQSALDPEVLLAAVPSALRPTVWAKRSLFGRPFLGWAMRAAGFIPVDREDRRGAPELLAATARQLRQGRSVVVFPEETYGDGEALLPFQRGAFLLALRERAAILPVGVVGTRTALPPYGRLVRPTPLVVRFGAPVETAGRTVSERQALVEETRAALADLCGVPAEPRGG